MKIKKITTFLPILALTLLSASLTTQAQNKDKDPSAVVSKRWTGPMQVQIYSETIEISALEYAKIMSAPSVSSNHTALRNKLIKQVEAGKTKLASNQLLVSRSGERGTIESVNKFTHATKYESHAITEVNGEPKSSNHKALQSLAPPTPSAFYISNLGETLETVIFLAEPHNKDHKILDVFLKSNMVEHVDNNVHAEWSSKDVKASVTTPNFSTLQLNTSLTLSKGEFTLVGAYATRLDGKSDNTKKLLHFVKADIIKVGKK